ARDLFLKYDFLKSAEQALSTYAEAVREFDKARRVAVSRLAQAEAKLNSAQGQYEVQTRQLKDFHEQLEKCTLRAKKSGLVVYGGSRDDMMYYGGEERIREGATVRERQAIMPDNGKQVCYIAKGLRSERREVQIGEFNDEFIEIKNGLKEGDRVLLRTPGAPEGAEPDKPANDEKAPVNDKKPQPVPASIPATASKA